MTTASWLTSPARDGDALGFTIPETWLQGRTSYGGLSSAIAFTAAASLAGDLPPLRSAQIAFVGPLSGDVRATPSLLRRGKSSAFIACDVTGADGAGLRALFLFMAARPSSIEHDTLALTPPDRPAAGIVDGATIGPAFLAHFEMATLPTREPASWRRWVRLKDRDGLPPETEFILIADALPPAAMALAAQWGPVSSATWQINLLTDRPSTEDGWWLMEAVSLAAHDGASSQSMTIWNTAGTPVATATQSVALFV